MSDAESMVILGPMVHVGCARASAAVTRSSSSRLRPKKGPPEHVSHMQCTSLLRSPTRHWKMALCSESTGSTRPGLAIGMSRSPPATRASLLAGAQTLPARSAS